MKKSKSEVIATQKDITISADDGYPLAATTFTPEYQKTAAAIVIGAALGVPRYIYYKLAAYLADQGFAVLTFDYRGVHQSQSNSITGSQIKMSDWGTYDIDAALQWSLQQWQPNTLVYLGHSCGGQLLGLSSNSTHVDKAIFVASPSGYWKLWPFPHRLVTRLVWAGLSGLSPWVENFPARSLGISSVDIPGGVARQWAQWGKSPNYLWDHINTEALARYNKLSFPLYSIGFTDDRYFGPPRAVEKLLQYYPSAETDFQLIPPSQYNEQAIGHFGFLKEQFRNKLWPTLAQWIAE